MTPTTRTTPDAWARANRTYPPTAGIPGPRDPRLTPYVIPFVRAVHSRTHKRVVMVVGAQMGKSDSILDIIGERMDTSPVPMLYLGPTKQFLQEQWEPRIMQLLDEAPPLRFKLARGKRMTKTRKIIAGVPLRLAHGGSSIAIKSDPFGLAFTDEADELLANVKGSGDPISQVDRRGDTYADFVHAIVSTPTEGPSDVDVDDASGLEFWADIDPQEVASTIWRLWQGGTRYHWAWPCPHCGEFFIPRFRCLAWDKPVDASGKELRSDPMLAAKTAHLVCPRNRCVITDDARQARAFSSFFTGCPVAVIPSACWRGSMPAGPSDKSADLVPTTVIHARRLHRFGFSRPSDMRPIATTSFLFPPFR